MDQLTPQLLEYLKMTFGPGAVVTGLFIARGIWKVIPALFETIVEMRLLRKELDEVKKYGRRLDKVETDLDVLHSWKRETNKGVI